MSQKTIFNSKKIPESIMKNWQRIVNIMANMLDTTAALITRVKKPYIKILTTNISQDNPLNEGEILKLTGHYCEQVINNREMLEVINSIESNNWVDNPELEYDLISYLGFPIIKPNGEVFGTICVLDKKERKYSKTQKELLLEFKKIVESQLENIELRNELTTRLDEITGLKDKYETLFNNINDALFFHKYNPESKKNKIGKFIEVNETACKRLEYTREELLNLSPDEIDSSQFDESQEKKEILKQLDDQGEITFRAEHVSKKGNKIPVEINSKIIKYNNQKMVLSIARDITERKEKEKQLKIQKNLTQSSLDSLSAHIAVLDEKGVIKYTNQAWKNFAQNNGLAPTNCSEGINYLKICENTEGDWSEGAQNSAQGIKDIFAENQDLFTLEYPCHSPEKKRWFQMRVTPFLGEGPYAAVVAHENITERKLKEKKIKKEREKIKYYSFHDQMTGLYNRRYFKNELERLNKSRQVPISVIVGDIDGLKYINDNHGHPAGDKFLKEAGNIINNNIREADILARIGGDEFSVILPETSSKSAQNLCERIKTAFEDFNKQSDLPEPLKISLGFATMTKMSQDLNDIFSKADQKMYGNKGRRRKKLF